MNEHLDQVLEEALPEVEAPAVQPDADEAFVQEEIEAEQVA